MPHRENGKNVYRREMNLTLETSKERVELLKAGISGKKIEELYIQSNNFRIENNFLHWKNLEMRL